MAFTVEDGTGLVATANAYISVAEFKAYWADRDPVDPSILTDAIERAIVKSTDYADLKYGAKFPGVPLEVDQPLLWPRDWNVDQPVPTYLKYAIAEYANYALSEDLYFRPSYDDSGKRITRLYEKVGPIETATDWSDGGGTDWSRKVFPKAEAWMRRVTYTALGGVYR